MTTTRAAGPAAAPHRRTTTRPVVPAPRRSPEESHDDDPAPGRPPDESADVPLYPLVRYAMEHATALRPRED